MPQQQVLQNFVLQLREQMLLLEILDFDFVLHELLVHFLLVVVQAPPLLLPFANILRVVSSDIVRKLGVLRVLHVCPLQLLGLVLIH